MALAVPEEPATNENASACPGLLLSARGAIDWLPNSTCESALAGPANSAASESAAMMLARNGLATHENDVLRISTPGSVADIHVAVLDQVRQG
jgi:hypothetical protein